MENEEPRICPFDGLFVYCDGNCMNCDCYTDMDSEEVQ